MGLKPVNLSYTNPDLKVGTIDNALYVKFTLENYFSFNTTQQVVRLCISEFPFVVLANSAYEILLSF